MAVTRIETLEANERVRLVKFVLGNGRWCRAKCEDDAPEVSSVCVRERGRGARLREVHAHIDIGLPSTPLVKLLLKVVRP